MCGLALLLAATPARNSDLWLHLASGRLLSEGRLPDGTDPFSSTTQGVYWVNHTWLSDLLLYQLHRIHLLGEGATLVVVKAALTTLLAALLLCFRRRGEGMRMPLLAGFLAILALGPWLLLQTTLLSLLGVVLTLYLLERPDLLKGAAAERARAQRWLLVLLFALWANLDSWFLLGPLLVGLYAIGELLRRDVRARSGSEGHSSPLAYASGSARSCGARSVSEGRSPLAYASGSAILFFAGLAACLATPYHYHIFDWPTPLGLTHTEQALQHDPLGQTLILSPFGARFATSTTFRSPGAWAYYLLLGASAASFVLSRRTLHGGRLLAWLALAALSIYQARTIPFFAVAAAPFLALNVQEWARNRPVSEQQYRLRIAALRLGVLVGIVLLVLAWPGWLQPAPYQPRGWTVEPDGSLVRLAQQLNRWHAEARFQPDRFALTFSPEIAHYLAWACPDEKGFLDSRWPLFDRVADDYVRMRRYLLEGDDADAGPELTSLLDAHQIDRVVLYDPDWDRNARAYRHLFLATSEWELLAVEGGATLFRRRGSAPSAEAFDYQRAAYHPSLDQRAPLAARPPQPPGWFEAFHRRREAHPADREEAALHLLSFDLLAEQQHTRLVRQWQLAHATGLIGCGCGAEPAGAASALAVRLDLIPGLPTSGSAEDGSAAGQSESLSVAEQFAAAYLALHDDAPSEPLLLAVRAARRALAVDPEDAYAFLFLGKAYARLAQRTREPSWGTRLPDLAALRQAQILTTLEQAVLLRPDLDQAHDLLAQLYLAQGQRDRALDHRRAQLQILEASARRRGSAASLDREQLAALQAHVEDLEKLVNQGEKTYQANLAGKTDPSKVLMRAELAARNGLSRKALQMLVESSPAVFGRPGVEYELDLMIKAGQSYQLRDWLEPEYEFKIDFEMYHWLKARAAASCGEYAEADAELNRGSEPLRRVPLLPKVTAPVRSTVAFQVARAVLTRPLAAEIVFETLHPLALLTDRLRQEADQQVLRGLLALESGAVEAAGQHFRAALDVWESDTAVAAGSGLDFPARPIAQQMLRRLQE
jgi:hypothetical protein